MIHTGYLFVVLAAGLVLGFVLSLLFYKVSSKKKSSEMEQKANRLLEDATKEAPTAGER